MSLPLEKLEAEVLELPAHDRARLARRLIASLDEGFQEDPAEVEKAWAEEIQRRLTEYHTGGGQTVPASDVLAEARARIRRA